jgi:hypothetical protein
MSEPTIFDYNDPAEWSASRFVAAKKLAEHGDDVPGSAFLMLEAARQYHMAEITRLERFMTDEVLDSKAVVDLAIARLSLRPEEREQGGKRLVYNKATKKIEVVRKDGLVVDSFDPPLECDSSPQPQPKEGG